MPQRWDWQVFFTNSGAESVEGAMKLARYYTRRIKFISFSGGFHGRTFGAMSLGSAFDKLYQGFQPLLPVVEVLPYGDVNALNSIYYPKDMLAAVIVEVVQGVGGCRVASRSFLQSIREFCTRHGVLMVADEVQSGIGRTGRLWAIEHSEVVPDVICSAKALGGGLPLGAVIAKKKFMTWTKGCHGSTFAGNPVACAAALKVLELLDEDFLKEVRSKGRWFRRELEKKLRRPVHGLGLMLAVDFGDAQLRDRIVIKAAQKGLLVLESEPASVRLLPPLNTPREVLNEIVKILKACKKECKK